MIGKGKLQSGHASLIARWPDVDLAVIKINSKRLPVPLSLSLYEPRPLLEVLAYGYPVDAESVIQRNREPVVTVTDGIVGRVLDGALKGGGQKIRIVQHNAAIGPGNSGGPIVDRCGRVVAVNVMRRHLQTNNGAVPVGEGIAFSVVTDELNTRLEKLGIERIVEDGDCIEPWQTMVTD